MAYLVAVDSGHGMETAGKRTPKLTQDLVINGQTVRRAGEIIHEKEWNKAVAEALITALNRCGIDTVNVSPGTDDVALSARVAAANSAGADIYISEHYNAAKGVWWDGGYFVAFYSQYASEATKRLAAAVCAEQAKVVPWPSNGYVTDVSYGQNNLYVLRHTTMPAVLFETGFMDVWESAKRMLDPAFVQEVAEAQCKGICNYFGVGYVAPDGSATAPAPEPEPTLEPEPAPEQPPTIRKGSSGAWVKKLQELLLPLGYVLPRYGTDGDYGDETYYSVRLFQAVNGLSVDGICGPKTWAALQNGGKGPTWPTLHKGDRGEFVRYMQYRLNYHRVAVDIDGIFGAKTQAGVILFQKAHCSMVDGIPGTETWELLKGC